MVFYFYSFAHCSVIFSDSHLHPSFPLLLPGVGDRPVVLRLQRLVVRQLHCGDQVLPEQLKDQNGEMPRFSMFLRDEMESFLFLVRHNRILKESLIQPML